MALSHCKYGYPPRKIKTVKELKLKENQKLAKANLYDVYKIHECVHASTDGSKVVEFFRGKSIFITGATGTCGKVLLEKLLRTCKEIDTIYIIVRTKKCKSVDTRLNELLSSSLYSELKKSQPNFREKIVVMEGDITLPGLGMCHADREILIEKVGVIFHVAATVRFNEKLAVAAVTNVGATKEVMILARHCKNLASFVHVSTAYSHLLQRDIDESFYEPAYTSADFLQMVKSNTETYLQENEKKILAKWPNTYTFTKAIAEDTVRTMGRGLPVCIYRPGQVIATHKEPLKAWMDTIQGVMGIILAGGTGVIRGILLNPDAYVEIIPVDYVANAMIVAAYQNQFSDVDEIKIYNHVVSPENPVKLKHFVSVAKNYALQNPSPKIIRPMHVVLIKNYFIFVLYTMVFHFIPAIFMDGYLLISGRKSRMVKLYKMVHKLCCELHVFAKVDWEYHNNNIQKMWNDLSEIDKKLFTFSMKDLNWNEYLQILPSGFNIHLFKGEAVTPGALEKYQRIKFYYKCLSLACYSAVLFVGYWILSRLSFMWV